MAYIRLKERHVWQGGGNPGMGADQSRVGEIDGRLEYYLELLNKYSDSFNQTVLQVCQKLRLYYGKIHDGLKDPEKMKPVLESDMNQFLNELKILEGVLRSCHPLDIICTNSTRPVADIEKVPCFLYLYCHYGWLLACSEFSKLLKSDKSGWEKVFTVCQSIKHEQTNLISLLDKKIGSGNSSLSVIKYLIDWAVNKIKDLRNSRYDTQAQCLMDCTDPEDLINTFGGIIKHVLESYPASEAILNGVVVSNCVLYARGVELHLSFTVRGPSGGGQSYNAGQQQGRRSGVGNQGQQHQVAPAGPGRDAVQMTLENTRDQIRALYISMLEKTDQDLQKTPQWFVRTTLEIFYRKCEEIYTLLTSRLPDDEVIPQVHGLNSKFMKLRYTILAKMQTTIPSDGFTEASRYMNEEISQFKKINKFICNAYPYLFDSKTASCARCQKPVLLDL